MKYINIHHIEHIENIEDIENRYIWRQFDSIIDFTFQSQQSTKTTSVAGFFIPLRPSSKKQFYHYSQTLSREAEHQKTVAAMDMRMQHSQQHNHKNHSKSSERDPNHQAHHSPTKQQHQACLPSPKQIPTQSCIIQRQAQQAHNSGQHPASTPARIQSRDIANLNSILNFPSPTTLTVLPLTQQQATLPPSHLVKSSKE